MDVLRPGYTYRTRMRFDPNSDETFLVQWYPVPADRPFLPIPGAFFSWEWEENNRPGHRCPGTLDIGEQIDSPRNVVKPPAALPVFTGHYEGTPEQWINGGPSTLTPPHCIDPANLPALWLRQDDLQGLAGDQPLDAWPGVEGTSRDAVPLTEEARPFLYTSSTGTKVPVFNGNTTPPSSLSVMVFPPISLPSGGSVWLVCAPLGVGNLRTGPAVINGTGSIMFPLVQRNVVSATLDGGITVVQSGPPSLETGRKTLLVAEKRFNTVFLLQDDTILSFGSAQGDGPVDRLTASRGPAAFADKPVAVYELVAFDRPLDQMERDSWLAYLSGKYQIHVP